MLALLAATRPLLEIIVRRAQDGFDFAGTFPPLVVERLIRCLPSDKGLRSMVISAGTDLHQNCDGLQDGFEHDAVHFNMARGMYLVRANIHFPWFMCRGRSVSVRLPCTHFYAISNA
jgi:hypothetical protein